MMQKLHINYATVPQNYGAFQVYACITHNYTTFTQIVYAAITHTLRRNYANKLRTLRKYYAEVTQRIYAIITQFYAKIMHYLRKAFTQYTQRLRKYVYAGITQISHAYAITLRRYYADITQINYAFITHITQILRK